MATTVKVQVIKPIWQWLKGSRAKFLLLYGGSGSGKSYTVAQHIVINHLLKGHNIRTLATRKTGPALRETSYTIIKEVLDYLQVPYIENKSEWTIMHGSNELVFKAIDDPKKVKSSAYNYIWMEEATEFTMSDFQMLKLLLRRHNERRNQMILTFNPIKSTWVYDHFFEQRAEQDIDIMQVTYEINPFLPEDYKAMLEDLRTQDATLYQIYTRGEFAEPANLIYNNWQVIDDKQMPAEFDEVIIGGDFGFNNPTAVLKIGIKDNVLYIIDEIYKTHLTNTDLLGILEDFYRPKSVPSYWDAAEPARIEELYRAGYNAHPASKSVFEGITKVKTFKIYVSSKCTNTIKELRTYSWRQDKNGKILDEPVKFNDHAMDALRYAVFTHFKDQKGVAIWTL